MTELEKKLLLTKDEYDYLMERFGYESSLNTKPMVSQTNYYFDTDDLSMNRKNITCRIRLKDGKYKGTMKQHSLDSDQSTETDIEVRNGLDDNAFIDMDLKLQGALITDRCVILKDANYEVVIDKNEYLGYTDYELEIEYSPNHETEAYGIMHSIFDILIYNSSTSTLKDIIVRNTNIESKSTRFFNRRIKSDFNT